MIKSIILKLFLIIYFVCSLNNCTFSQYWNSTDGGNNIFNTNQNNVGIGVFQYNQNIIPLTTLHVLSNGTVPLLLQSLGSLTNILFQDPTGYSNGYYSMLQVSNDLNSGYFNFLCRGTSLLKINNNGYVGIGTTTPSEKLELLGNLKLTSQNTNVTSLKFQNNTGKLGIDFWTFGDVGGRIDFVADYSNPNYDQMSIGQDGNVRWGNDISWLSSDQNGSISLNKGGWYSASNTKPKFILKTKSTLKPDNIKSDLTSSYQPYIDLSYGNTGGQMCNQFSARIQCTADNRLDFYTADNSGLIPVITNVMTFENDGVFAKKITVQSSWSDFVFNKNYHLLSLTELEKYVKENKHLPDMPSEQEVKEKGVELGEMASKLTQKIEELTLYVIDLNKEIEKLKNENDEMKKIIDEK